MFKNCIVDIKCDICGNFYYVIVMYIDCCFLKFEFFILVLIVKIVLSNGGEYEEGKYGSCLCGKIVLVDVFC